MHQYVSDQKQPANENLRGVAATPQPLGRRGIFGYSVGDLGINLNFQLIGFFLAYFYTDVFGLAPTHVAGLFFSARVFDALIDPVMGYIADHTRTRWGRFRPYVLLGAVPLNLMLVACFSTPDWSPGAKVVYAYVTYFLHGVAFTAVALPYSSLSATMTQEPHERSLISSYRMFFAVIVALSVVSIGVRPLVATFASESRGFATVAASFAVISTLLLWIAFAQSRERVALPREQYKVSDVARIVLKNDQLLWLSVSMFLNTCVWVIGSAVALYYFKYVAGDPGLGTAFFLWMLPANLAGTVLAPALAARLGKRNVFIFGSAVVALLYLARHLLPTDARVPFIALSMIASFGQMLCSISQWAMLPDTVEYGHLRTGIRSEGIPFALFSFTQKLGMAAGGAAAVLVMQWTGYAANQAQSASALNGIRWLFNLLPALFSMVCLATLLRYRLSESRFSQVRAELAAREGG